MQMHGGFLFADKLAGIAFTPASHLLLPIFALPGIYPIVKIS